MSYKDTLNLLKTSFPMKGNLPQVEPQQLKAWKAEDLFFKLLEQHANDPSFVLHDGPPYANGNIHMGHALNKILKDFVVRYQFLQGKKVHYVPGWDCHGLPIEYALMKELGVTKHEVDLVEFRKKARNYATKFVETQKKQFQRLGCLGDWDDPYLTLKPEYVSAALNGLAELTEKGFVYRARRPVNWCWTCETALAEAEVEYQEHVSPSIYVKFELDEASRKKLLPEASYEKVSLMIWTTTPWTLMGNVAVAVHPKFKYGVREVSASEAVITLSTLPASANQHLPEELLDPSKVAAEIEGVQLEGLRYQHPLGLTETDYQVVLADYVSDEDGTGLVHTAPGFGADDHATGKKYGLDVLAPVDVQGCFAGLSEVVAAFNGKHVHKANPDVIATLEQSGHLVAQAKIDHQYPHCWRCHSPIIFRATDQWFLKIDHNGFRQRLEEVILNEVNWVPAEGRERIHAMVAGRPDWCLSRQRLWGIPIPAVTCNTCQEGVLLPEVVRSFAQAVAQEPGGSDQWFTRPLQDWLPDGFACACGSTDFQRGEDILDVWFDSGMSHQGVLEARDYLSVPADLYLEGSDQHRGWFQVSLITAVGLLDHAPYKSVLTHGFVVDGDGRKMSKSQGNVIAPTEIVDKYGADVLRLWVAASDFSGDVRLSEEIVARVVETYRKIRNTLRFCLSNIADFDPVTDAVSYDALRPLDQWVLHELRLLAVQVQDAFENYTFHTAVRLVHEFCTVKLSNFYLDIIKDRLYTDAPTGQERRSIQTALHQITQVLMHVVAPILPFTTDTAFQALAQDAGRDVKGIQTSAWPEVNNLPTLEAALVEQWNEVRMLRDGAMKELERLRETGDVGNSLEAEMTLQVKSEKDFAFAQDWQAQLESVFLVSKLEIVLAPELSDGWCFEAVKSAQARCERCWVRLETVGQNAQNPDLCGRCSDIVKSLADESPVL